MHYLFLDESYRYFDDKKVYFWAAIFVDQRLWLRLADDARNLKTPQRGSRLAKISKLVTECHGIALATYAVVDQSLIRPGLRCHTTWNEDISMQDVAWSTTLTMTVAITLSLFNKLRCKIGTVDVYLDPRTLTRGHSTDLEDVFMRRRYRNTPSFRPHLRRFAFVSKPAEGKPPNPIQEGIAVADRLCQDIKKPLVEPNARRVYVKDIMAQTASALQRLHNEGAVRKKKAHNRHR